MNKYSKSRPSKLLWLLTLTALILSLLASCKQKENTDDDLPYVAGSKEQIRANIAESLKTKESELGTVTEYLELWGVALFDRIKFSYLETCFISVYNYGDGLPETELHAKETAELFLDDYYDKIDRSDLVAATDSLLFCYVEVLDDPYSVYRPPVDAEEYTTDMSGKFGGIGVVIEYDDKNETIQVTTVYPESPADTAGVLVGDYIYAVNGVTVDEIGYRNAVYHIRGEKGTSVEITLLRDGEYVTVNAVRSDVEETNAAYSFDEETGIGYVQIVAFKGNTFSQFKKCIDELEKLDLKGIVFDVRGNPGGYVESVCDVVSYLVPTGETIVSYAYKGSEPIVRKSKDDGTKTGEDGVTVPYDHVVTVPMVVLCDEYTASSGEIFTAAIRDYKVSGIVNATIVGTNTYKKGIMQNTYVYSADGSTVTLTIAYYNPPCGINYHGVGVAPDVTVELPKAERDPETGKFLPVEDTQLKSGLEELKKLINAN